MTAPPDDNVVTLRPVIEAPADVEPSSAEQRMTLDNLVAFCERLNEGLQHVASVLVQTDARLRRLELAQNKVAREKPKPVILNAHGKQAN